MDAAYALPLRNGQPSIADDGIPADPLSKQDPTDDEILAALRPLYGDQSAADMGAEDDLRTARAVLARWGRPAAPPVPEPVEDPHLQDMLWGVPGQAAAPADQPTDADRLALALCTGDWDESNPDDCFRCIVPCTNCRHQSASHCRELAKILRERHGGSSQFADWLDGVGTHP
jgi:hypothetical protein